MLAFLLARCRSADAQQAEEKLAMPERAFVASKIYSSIQIYFAHQTAIAGLDLDAAYKTYLHSAMDAKDRREFDLATMEFVAELRNKHTQFDDQWLHQKYGQPLGFSVLPVEGKWGVTWSSRAEMKRGDCIRAIDGISVETFVHDKQRYINASSERSAMSLVFDRPYLFPNSFTIEMADGRKLVIERAWPKGQATSDNRPAASEGRWLAEDSVGYIKIPAFNDPNYEKSAIDWVRKIQSAKANCLIIDVRDNGGGSTPYQLIRVLMHHPWRDWSSSTPLQVARDQARGEPVKQFNIESENHQPEDGAFSGRVILLINRFTCSASEDFVMPFKDNGRATIIGETTEGSSGQPFYFNFNNGMMLLVGAERHTFPDGSLFESVGIQPTIPVEIRLGDIRSGADPVLDKAKKVAGVP